MEPILTATQKSTTRARTAHISIGAKGDLRAVRVSHPGKLTPDEIARIDKVLVNDVIKDLTGCACLSGTIDVIWEKQFDRILDVQLGR
ncbi:hypothetical protein [Sphingomonas sp.]|jgi:hypothetical protein|uniref:hypothetical protein n=1 Tax=Sphingomonas sp. TaxID=28214 RepID=UPI002DB62F13|nr:hypothetical protein [Sphingomonas sp.]HEU4967572.1 hypothetical protein [Sphingomonas sp.]